MKKYEQILQNLENNLKTPIEELARVNLFVYALLYNREIEPDHDYTDKFFTILSHEFQEFDYNSIADVLLLEASPRTGKTDFVVNIYLSWLLGNKKDKRFLFVASNKTLKDSLRRKIERVIKSKFFTKVFGNIQIETNNQSEISLSNLNSINLITTFSTVPIGTGFHYHFYIDFLTGETMRSDVNRETAFNQFQLFSSRTQNNPPTKIIIDNQRLGVYDLSAYITRQYAEMNIDIKRITFPYQFEDDYYYKIGDKEIKFERNSYLVKRFNEFEKKKIIARMGQYVYETQYLQKARPARGDMVNREMFRFYTKQMLDNVKFKKGFITTDLALEKGKRNDYNVFIFWLVDEDNNLYLIDMFRQKIRGVDAELALYNFYQKWKNGLGNGQAGCHFITFENTTNTKHTIQRYEDGFNIGNKKITFAGLVRKLSRPKDKFSRFVDALPFIQSSCMFLPSADFKINGVENINDEIIEPFLREYEAFREDMSHEHDDIVDCGSDAVEQVWKQELDLSVKF